MIMPNPYLIVQGEITYVPLLFFVYYILLLLASNKVYLIVKGITNRIGYVPFILSILFIFGSIYTTYILTGISDFYVIFKILGVIAISVIFCILFTIFYTKLSVYIDEDRKRNGYIEEETISESELSKDANYVTEKEETELREEIKEIKE